VHLSDIDELPLVYPRKILTFSPVVSLSIHAAFYLVSLLLGVSYVHVSWNRASIIKHRISSLHHCFINEFAITSDEHESLTWPDAVDWGPVVPDGTWMSTNKVYHLDMTQICAPDTTVTWHTIKPLALDPGTQIEALKTTIRISDGFPHLEMKRTALKRVRRTATNRRFLT
jgi:hypothetical protein